VGLVRIKCPIEVAIQIMEANKIQIGRSWVKVRLINRDSVRCYKCWASGHVFYSCPESFDRRGRCFRCGAADHMVKDCDRSLNCIICAENNVKANHWAGGPNCRPIPPNDRFRY
jgi:hypothetical protein